MYKGWGWIMIPGTEGSRSKKFNWRVWSLYQWSRILSPNYDPFPNPDPDTSLELRVVKRKSRLFLACGHIEVNKNFIYDINNPRIMFNWEFANFV